jgi:hypothetical protein
MAAAADDEAVAVTMWLIWAYSRCKNRLYATFEGLAVCAIDGLRNWPCITKHDCRFCSHSAWLT